MIYVIAGIFKGVKCLMAIQPISMEVFVRTYAKKFLTPIKVPTLYVQARHDPWTELGDIQGFYQDTPPPKEFFWIEDTKHRNA